MHIIQFVSLCWPNNVTYIYDTISLSWPNSITYISFTIPNYIIPICKMIHISKTSSIRFYIYKYTYIQKIRLNYATVGILCIKTRKYTISWVDKIKYLISQNKLTAHFWNWYFQNLNKNLYLLFLRLISLIFVAFLLVSINHYLNLD